MDFISTRSLNTVSIEEALLSGTAKDGGLYLPSEIPKIDRNDFLEPDDYVSFSNACLLYTSDAADDTPCVDLGGRRII